MTYTITLKPSPRPGKDACELAEIYDEPKETLIDLIDKYLAHSDGGAGSYR